MTERFPTRRGDWMLLNCGDSVIDVDDERHVGRIMSIINGYMARVKWQRTGWISEVPIHQLLRREK